MPSRSRLGICLSGVEPCCAALGRRAEICAETRSDQCGGLKYRRILLKLGGEALAGEGRLRHQPEPG